MECAMEDRACICVVTRGQAKKQGKELIAQPENGPKSASSKSSEGVTKDTLTSKDACKFCDCSSQKSSMVSKPNETDKENSPLTEIHSSSAPHSNWMNQWSTEEIKNLQEGDPVIQKILKWKEKTDDCPSKSILTGESREVKLLCAQWPSLKIENGILYRQWASDNPREENVKQLVVPFSLRQKILHTLHGYYNVGHLGRMKTLQSLRRKFYWPGHKTDVIR
jgi:hypothetical protein